VPDKPDGSPPAASPRSQGAAAGGDDAPPGIAGETTGSHDGVVDDSIDVSMSSSAIPVRGSGRTRAAGEKLQGAVSSGVEHLGSGITALGDGLSKVASRVDKIPGLTKTKLGTGVRELGEGISDLGESLTHLPQVARSRRGRVMARSLVLGFLMILTWITVIVYFQVRGGTKPDLRPDAEAILVQLRDGHYQQLLAQASPRMQEIVKEGEFVVRMTDMRESLGRFREITSVNETTVGSGAGGRIASVELSLLYERGEARGTVSFHWDEGKWKLLGISIELIGSVKERETRPERRAERVKAPPEVTAAAERIITLVREGKPEVIWGEASKLFQGKVTRDDFVQLDDERRKTLGPPLRILDTRAHTSPSQTSASVDALVQYENENAIVSTSFGFEKDGDAWRLTSYKVVLPMPRAPLIPSH
jgi:hypothetical protein